MTDPTTPATLAQLRESEARQDARLRAALAAIENRAEEYGHHNFGKHVAAGLATLDAEPAAPPEPQACSGWKPILNIVGFPTGVCANCGQWKTDCAGARITLRCPFCGHCVERDANHVAAIYCGPHQLESGGYEPARRMLTVKPQEACEIVQHEGSYIGPRSNLSDLAGMVEAAQGEARTEEEACGDYIEQLAQRAKAAPASPAQSPGLDVVAWRRMLKPEGMGGTCFWVDPGTPPNPDGKYGPVEALVLESAARAAIAAERERADGNERERKRLFVLLNEERDFIRTLAHGEGWGHGRTPDQLHHDITRKLTESEAEVAKLRGEVERLTQRENGLRSHLLDEARAERDEAQAALAALRGRREG